MRTSYREIRAVFVYSCCFCHENSKNVIIMTHIMWRSCNVKMFYSIVQHLLTRAQKPSLKLCCLWVVWMVQRPSHEWRRTCGQTSTSWTHQICHDTGVTATEALQLAEDRPFWRTIATVGGSSWTLRVTMMMMMLASGSWCEWDVCVCACCCYRGVSGRVSFNRCQRGDTDEEPSW